MTTETKTMTREEFERNLLVLIGWKCPVCQKGAVEHFYASQKPEHWPDELPYPYEGFEYIHRCRGMVNGEWAGRDETLLSPLDEISEAKRLTDELIKEGWNWFIDYHSGSVKPYEHYVGKSGSIVDSFGVRAEAEELARSLAYYQAKTGIRVEIKENDAG